MILWGVATIADGWPRAPPLSQVEALIAHLPERVAVEGQAEPAPAAQFWKARCQRNKRFCEESLGRCRKSRPECLKDCVGCARDGHPFDSPWVEDALESQPERVAVEGQADPRLVARHIKVFCARLESLCDRTKGTCRGISTKCKHIRDICAYFGQTV